MIDVVLEKSRLINLNRLIFTNSIFYSDIPLPTLNVTAMPEWFPLFFPLDTDRGIARVEKARSCRYATADRCRSTRRKMRGLIGTVVHPRDIFLARFLREREPR